MTLLFAVTSFARTIPVGKGTRLTIQQGLAKASDGDTVKIMAGLYKEGNLIIKRSVTILGVGLPVLDGEDRYEIFTISANDVTITGLKMINTGVASINDISAISATRSDRIKVLNNEFENTFFGIRLANCKGALIGNNTLHSKAEMEHQIGNGIHAWKCDSLTIRNNTVSGHRDGIYFEFVTNSFIVGNYSHHNKRYGLHFMFSHQDEYHNNIFQGNGSGVAVMYTKSVRMVGNRFEDNWGASSYGLLLKDISDSFIDRNQFSRNTTGIYLEGTSRCSFKGNTFGKNGWAVKMQANCDGNEFERNNFLGNTFDLSTNGSLVLNTIDYNYWDNYQGYDLDKDGVGDVPYHPVSLYSMVVEKMPSSVMLWRSFLVHLLDKSERVVPSITPENLVDAHPSMMYHD